MSGGSRWALPAWSLGLPLLLLALGCWGWWRADGRLTLGLGALAALLGVMAVLVSALGLLYLHHLGVAAMASRSALLQAFERGRRIFPAYLQGMVVLLYASAVVLMVYALVWMFQQPMRSPGVIVWVGVGALSMVCAGYVTLSNARMAARLPLDSAPASVVARVVRQEEGAALWAFVQQVAARIGATPPDHVLIGLANGFFVTEHAVHLQGTEQVLHGRTLYLSLPFLAYLDDQELGAVVAHELGHFLGEDTVFTQRFRPIFQATVLHLDALTGPTNGWLDGCMRRPVWLFGAFFLDTFERAVLHWARVRELAADAVGAQAYSPKAMASALLRTAALASRVDELVTEVWEEQAGHEARPAQTDLLARLSQHIQSKGLDDPRGLLAHSQSHPIDTHPDLATRLAALGVSVSSALLARAMDARSGGLLDRFALSPDVHGGLRDELQTVARDQRAGQRRVLEAMAQAGQSMEVHEQTRFMVWVLGILAVVLLCFSAWAAFKGASEGALVLLVLAMPWAIWGLLAWRDGRKPAVVISVAGLQVHGTYLAWSELASMSAQVHSSNLRLTLTVEEGVAMPKLGVRRGRAKLNRKRRQLVLTLKGVSGPYLVRVNEALQTSLDAHRARQALQDWDRSV